MTFISTRVRGLHTVLDLRALVLPSGLVLAVPLLTGCPKVCSDDGFAWQQDPACAAQLSLTEDTAGTDTNTPTEPTTSGGGNLWCVDADGDGFGDPNNCTEVPPGQQPPDGSVDNDDDCDDGDADTFPGAAPNDDATACMKDADGDDWGDTDPPGGGGVVPGTDCDDADVNTFKGAAPNDDPDACMKDEDGDDWGDDDPQGGGSPGGVVPGTDCNDANKSAWDTCGACTDADMDGWLADCDSYPPEFPGPDCDDADPDTFPGSAPNDDPDACMKDADGDDWGDDMPMNPAVTPGTDCDDLDAQAFKGAAPKDDPNACMKDADGDDWGDNAPSDPDVTPGTDCDDTDPDTYKGAAEANPDECMKDADDDGHGDADPGKPGVVPGDDCYDANPDLNPDKLVLITAAINTGEIMEVDPATGAVTPYAMVNVAGFNPWIPTSVAVNPTDGSVVAALAFRDRLVTMNYCGAGVPTDLPMPHKKSICGIGFDGAGNLYGIDGQVDQLLAINPDGSISPGGLKSLTFMGKTLNVADCGMAWDCHEKRLLISDSGSSGIYTVNTDDGTTTRLADLPGESFGSGVEYDPTNKVALSCDQTSFLSIALDGSNDFTKLPDLSSPADDLAFGPACN